MNTESRKILDPEVVSRINSYALKARLVVEGFMTGLHRSPYHGFSVEFAEHRPYMSGDSLKSIDWKVFAKSDRYFVKEYEEETNLKAYLLLDTSRSMTFSSGTVSKLEYCKCLTAALAYLFIQQRDAVGLVCFNEKIEKFLRPRSVSLHLQNILAELQNLSVGMSTKTGFAFHQLAEQIKRRGLVIILSDLFDDIDQIISGLKHFRHQQHEVLVFHVIDPYETNFSFSKEALFEDLESGQRLHIDPWLIKDDYARLFNRNLDRLRTECRNHQVDYVLLNTTDPYDKAFFAYLSKRLRLY